MERFDNPEEIAFAFARTDTPTSSGPEDLVAIQDAHRGNSSEHRGRRPLELNNRSPESVVLSRFVVDDQDGCGALIQYRVAGASQ